jgi:3-hydroxyisobutyrate dehydrogenase
MRPAPAAADAVRVGFLGLGAMGAHMARNLHQAGLLAAVWNRTPAKATSLAVELACSAPATPAELARETDTIVLCVSADQDVLDLIEALHAGLRQGQLVIDCSTVSAETARGIAARLAGAGVQFMDCPVSGGTEGARDGTLAIMCGGSPASFALAQPVLAAMGRTVTHFGPVGAGLAAKATNQIMCAGIIEAVSEAMAFAKANGLPLEKLVETLGKGAGSSWYFVHRAPNMIREAYPPGFRVRLHAKDLRICHAMAASFGVELPLVERMLAQYAQLIELGFGDEDISTCFRLKDQLFKAGG